MLMCLLLSKHMIDVVLPVIQKVERNVIALLLIVLKG
jgi:hypothetical protein